MKKNLNMLFTTLGVVPQCLVLQHQSMASVTLKLQEVHCLSELVNTLYHISDHITSLLLMNSLLQAVAKSTHGLVCENLDTDVGTVTPKFSLATSRLRGGFVMSSPGFKAH